MPTFPGLSQPKDILVIFPNDRRLFKSDAMFFDPGTNFYHIKKQLNLRGGLLIDPVSSFHYNFMEYQEIPSGVYVYRPHPHTATLKPRLQRIKLWFKHDIINYDNLKYEQFRYTQLKVGRNNFTVEINGIKYKYNYIKKYYTWKVNNITYRYNLEDKSLTWDEDVYNYSIKNILIKVKIT